MKGRIGRLRPPSMRQQFRPRNYRPDLARYEQEKKAWLDAHPFFTSEEYEQAMRQIATRCKI